MTMPTDAAAPATLQQHQQHQIASVPAPLPRVTIQFCTQCKWMLRAAYFAQELLSTFSLSLGEVALQPSTGGTFIVTIHHQNQLPGPEAPSSSSSSTAGTSPDQDVHITSKVLWDRKTDGGFPETKELKRRVRDVIEPGRNLGHVDRNHQRPSSSNTTGAINAPTAGSSASTVQIPLPSQAQARESKATGGDTQNPPALDEAPDKANCEDCN